MVGNTSTVNLIAMRNLTPEMCKTRAVVNLKQAVKDLQQYNLSDALQNYGLAMAYEECYDMEQTTPEINSLYRDCEEYRKLCLDWVYEKKRIVNLMHNFRFL